MPLQQAVRLKRQGRTNVIYRDAAGGTHAAILRTVSPRVDPPVLSAPTGSTTGGTLAAGTYSYRVSAIVGGVESLACAAQTGVVASGSTGSVALSWGAVSGATAYKVYGRTAGGELQLVSQAGTTYTDTGAATPSGALPTMATALVKVDTNDGAVAQGGAANVPQALTLRGTSARYFLRYGRPAGYPAPQRT
jgi:hypothetical protein